MDWQSRPARPPDAPAVLPWLAELTAGDAAQAQAAWAAAVRPVGGGEAWLAEGRVPGAPPGPLGFLALSPGGAPGFRVGSVEWLVVAPAARGRGVGRGLLALAGDRARALGWRQLHACTFHTNRPALHLYIAAGFFPAATLWEYAGPGLHYVELLRPIAPGPGPDHVPPAPHARPDEEEPARADRR